MQRKLHHRNEHNEKKKYSHDKYTVNEAKQIIINMLKLTQMY